MSALQYRWSMIDRIRESLGRGQRIMNVPYRTLHGDVATYYQCVFGSYNLYFVIKMENIEILLQKLLETLAR